MFLHIHSLKWIIIICFNSLLFSVFFLSHKSDTEIKKYSHAASLVFVQTKTCLFTSDSKSQVSIFHNPSRPIWRRKMREKRKQSEEETSTLSDTTKEKIQIECACIYAFKRKTPSAGTHLSLSLFPTKIIIARLKQHTSHTVTYYHSRWPYRFSFTSNNKNNSDHRHTRAHIPALEN